MKLNYIIIPLITLLVSVSGGSFAQAGIKRWYKKLKLPDTAPDNKFIGAAWSVIFILATISVLIVWNSEAQVHDQMFFYIFVLFALNALLNIFWNFIFFTLHMTGLAAIGALALSLSVLSLILLTLPISSLAAALLVPYFIWVSFATYLTYNIWQLNKVDGR